MEGENKHEVAGTDAIENCYRPKKHHGIMHVLVMFRFIFVLTNVLKYK